MSLSLDLPLETPLGEPFRWLAAMARTLLRSTRFGGTTATRARPQVQERGTDLSAFQHAIVPQLDAAYNFARFLSRDPDAAQDIVQEAFLRAYRGFAGFRGGDPRAWLFSIVRNCFHDWQLERRRRARLEAEPPPRHGPDEEAEPALPDIASDEDTPEAALLRKREAEAVRGVIARLARPLREILVLRELEDLPYREIAEVTGLPIGTVMSRLARARAALAEAWRAHEGVQAPGAQEASR